MNKSNTFTTFDSQSHTNLNISQKFKIVLLGDQSVGKTAIINRFIFDTFDGKDHPTVGIDFIFKTLYYEEKALKLQIWDTAGQERYRCLIPRYIRDCSVIIILYDVTNKQSFSSVKGWIDDVRTERGNDVLIAVIGNKVDLEQKRVVSREEGEAFAKENETLFMEVSAKTGFNVTSLFQLIAGFLSGHESFRAIAHDDQNKDLNIIEEPHNQDIHLIPNGQLSNREDGKKKFCQC